MQLKICSDYIRDAFLGIPNIHFGFELEKIMIENKELFDKYFREKFDFEMELKMSSRISSCTAFDQDFGARMNGFDSPEEYHIAS